MNYKETLPSKGVSRKEMLKRVARFKKLKGFDGGLPDSRMPGCERTLYNVIGFQPPRTERAGKQSPVGVEAARMAAIKILMFIIGGDAPSAEFTAESMRRLETAGIL